MTETAEKSHATDNDVDTLWRRLCDEVLMELVQQRLEELRGRS